MFATPYRPPLRRPRVAVVGGGISGLAAAHRLTELLPHAELEIFEGAARLGGVLETVQRDGFLLERAADNFLTSRPEGVDLCRRLGMAEQLLPTDESRRRALVVCGGRLLPIPAGFYLMSPRKLGPLVRSPVLSVRGKLRLLAERLVPRRPLPPEDDQEDADESVASFVCRRLGREVFERLVEPLVAGIYTADATKLSMAATMPEFLKMEREYGSLLRAMRSERKDESRLEAEDNPRSEILNPQSEGGARYGLFVAPRLGMASLVQALAARLPDGSVRLRAPVEKLRQLDNGQWQLALGDGGATEPFDAVILTVPAHVAARLLEGCDVEMAAELAAIPYASCAVVSCAYRRDQIAHPLDAFGFVVPRMEGRRMIAGSFASNKFPGRAPEGSVLIRAFVGGVLHPELVELPDAELRRVVLEELAELLTTTGMPQWTDVARWVRVMPQYEIGHLSRVRRIKQLAAQWPGLALAGNAYQGVGIPQCIASGEAAAQHTVSYMARPRLT